MVFSNKEAQKRLDLREAQFFVCGVRCEIILKVLLGDLVPSCPIGMFFNSYIYYSTCWEEPCFGQLVVAAINYAFMGTD